jgi:pilus assembly protein CpaF
VDARLKDGSRVHAIIPPLALKGPTLTIRKFPGDPLTAEDLVRLGSVSRGILQFLQACVSARRNILISGGTGSGKTTLLNVLSSFLPEHERILTIEDSAELRLRQVHVVSLEARPPNIEGKGQVTIRELVRNALRMRPDRIVVGECRGGEALDMLQAMNTGHDGSLTTIHANSPADAIARLETLVLMAGLDLPSRAIREQIASAIHIVVQTARLMDGSRKVVGVSAVTDLVDGQVRLQDVFRFTQTGLGERGAVIGRFNPTGWAPPFIAELPRQGIHLDPGVFEANRGGGIDPAGAAEPVAGNLFHTVRGGTP